MHLGEMLSSHIGTPYFCHKILFLLRQREKTLYSNFLEKKRNKCDNLNILTLEVENMKGVDLMQSTKTILRLLSFKYDRREKY